MLRLRRRGRADVWVRSLATVVAIQAATAVTFLPLLAERFAAAAGVSPRPWSGTAFGGDTRYRRNHRPTVAVRHSEDVLARARKLLGRDHDDDEVQLAGLQDMFYRVYRMTDHRRSP